MLAVLAASQALLAIEAASDGEQKAIRNQAQCPQAACRYRYVRFVHALEVALGTLLAKRWTAAWDTFY